VLITRVRPSSEAFSRPRQRSLPNLAGTNQGDGGLTIQGGLDDGRGMSLDEHRKSSLRWKMGGRDGG